MWLWLGPKLGLEWNLSKKATNHEVTVDEGLNLPANQPALVAVCRFPSAVCPRQSVSQSVSPCYAAPNGPCTHIP